MELTRKLRPGFAILVVAFVAAAVVGCNRSSTAGPMSTQVAYTGALDTAYDDALDATSQLALGTLRLEGTADAVTERQAAQLLPSWKVLQDSALQSDAERSATVRQIEQVMTESQVAAIATMQLTQADEQAWMQEQGIGWAGGFRAGGGVASGDAAPAGSAPGGAGVDRAAMRERFQNMTDEERAQMREQFPSQGGPGGIRPGMSAGASSGVVRAVVMLLAERSGQTVARAGFDRPTPASRDAMEVTETYAVEVTPTLEPTATPTPEPNAMPASPSEAEATDTPSAPATRTAEAVVEATASVTTSGSVAAESGSSDAATQASTAPVLTEAVVVAPAVTPALAQIPDTDPGPPFSVEISLNQATPNPLLDGTSVYKVSGLLRNNGTEVYAVNTVHVTFYDADGFRGSYNPFPRRRYGEYIWHGALEADFDCMLLAPGAACPFTAQIAAYDMGSFLVHADAVVADWREPATALVTSSALVDQGSTVRITGTIANPNEYAIKNVVVSGVLLDASGQITSMGSNIYMQSIAPGASVSVVTLVPKDTYTSYQVYVQAEGDFE